MNSTCARWSDRYVSANHWFIPADLLNQAAKARTRAGNVVNAALLAATAGPFYAFAYHLLGYNAAAIEILLDIDFFKRIKDTWGYSAGDTVPRAFAGTVQALVRGSDSFGRHGREEFLLMLPETTAADAMALAGRVRAAIGKMRCHEGGSEIALTVSIGVAEYRMAMAHRLDLKVIAECVETAEQLGDLGAMRCDQAQGCLFHRPLPAGQVGALLARQADQQAALAPA